MARKPGTKSKFQKAVINMRLKMEKEKLKKAINRAAAKKTVEKSGMSTAKKKLGGAKAKPAAKVAGKLAADHWFAKLSKKAQAEYIKAHPNSKFAKGAKVKAVAKDVKKEVKKEVKKVSAAEKKIAKDLTAAEKKHAAAKKAFEKHNSTNQTRNNFNAWGKKHSALRAKVGMAADAVKFHKKKLKLAAKETAAKKTSAKKTTAAAKKTAKKSDKYVVTGRRVERNGQLTKMMPKQISAGAKVTRKRDTSRLGSGKPMKPMTKKKTATVKKTTAKKK